jgi:type VI secretion system protein ImpJ
MTWNNRVIWSEGMLLQQQHLQQQDRYWLGQIESRWGTRRHYGWGFWKLAIDEAQLGLGKLALTACEGIMPDGTSFALPLDDELPLPLDIPETRRDALVVLALPLRRPGVAEMASGQHADERYARYRREACVVMDSNADSRESTEMEVGKLRLSLAFADDVTQAYAVLGVARVVECSEAAGVVLDRGYAPPCLDYRVAARLAAFVEELAGMLRQRGDAVAARLAQPGASGAAEIADFLLLQVINRSEPLMRHLASLTGFHPEALFRELVQLSGELSSFTTTGRRAAIPAPYRHDALADTFAPLADELRRSLSMVMEPQAVAIGLEQSQFGVSIGRVPDTRLLKTAEFVLAVRADMATDALSMALPAQMKVGPVERIHDLVNLQLPGVALRRLPVAPRQLPFRAGYCYFSLDTSDDAWPQIVASAAIALHVAGDFPGLEVQLWAIRQ